ncbi:hypothetical protein SISSUDRAFT_1127374 [Sistotremastrum suecicum HHB10207 ss-3]|uniref:BTB domain-containing protein n=1 Tax=Sistotremastrum suecicum HHB10207 ss-3 TaxID=1314776 RepID=A0A166F2N4_9AGAM|nr:hypothetical protein SISSUDRAFT_1127374 [Sistotremastrum suecicum HHB10207 ss-3]
MYFVFIYLSFMEITVLKSQTSSSATRAVKKIQEFREFHKHKEGFLEQQFYAFTSSPTDTMMPPGSDLSASAPFQLLDSNLIIRCSDQVDFKVHKSIMSTVSGVFRDMIALDHINQCSTPSDCVVTVSEDSHTMGALLRYIYPFPRPVLTDMNVIVRLLALADKYDVPHMTSALQEALRTSDILKLDIVRSYAVCRKYCLSEAEAIVIPELLKRPGPGFFGYVNTYPAEMDAITIEDVAMLDFYRSRRFDAVVGILSGVDIEEAPCPCRRDTTYEILRPTCTAWIIFIDICEEKIFWDPTTDISEPGIREAACRRSTCSDAKMVLWVQYAEAITQAKEEIEALPWIYPDEWTLARSVSHRRNITAINEVQYKYEQRG